MKLFMQTIQEVKFAATVKTWGRDNVVARGKYSHENEARLKPLQDDLMNHKDICLFNTYEEAEKGAKLALSKTSLQYQPDIITVYAVRTTVKKLLGGKFCWSVTKAIEPYNKDYMRIKD